MGLARHEKEHNIVDPVLLMHSEDVQWCNLQEHKLFLPARGVIYQLFASGIEGNSWQ